MCCAAHGVAEEPRLDIKDFILISGGLLILLVVVHGFWIAYRAKREPYRLDIVPDIIPDDVDDIERLRAELPNGGARVVNRKRYVDPAQTTLDLDMPAPTLMDVAREVAQEDAQRDLLRDSKRHPGQSAAPQPTVTDEVALEPIIATEPAAPRGNADAARQGRQRSLRQKDEARQQGGLSAGQPAQAPAPTDQSLRAIEGDDLPSDLETRHQEPETPVEPAEVRTAVRGSGQERGKGQVRGKGLAGKAQAGKAQVGKGQAKAPRHEENGSVAARDNRPAVEELLVVHLLAARGQRLEGTELVNARRRQNLRYGDMNIFHRIDPATKAKQFSVANVVEPGTFDLSDLELLRSPGISFFLQLPGPDSASTALEDMLRAVDQIALELDGELRDEAMSVLSHQTREHMRQRIADFARRRLSMRA